MRFARILAAALAALCIIPNAVAQSNPVTQHYRAYLAALDRSDFNAAATEAEAALAASEARDGDGGSTAVLAFNLATVRLSAGHPTQALAPAQRAFDLARNGAHGVDAAMAELTLARARLGAHGATPVGPEAAARLSALLTGPEAQRLPSEDIYEAAAQLGDWGFVHEDYVTARSAWAVAGARPGGSRSGEAYGLGRARASEGIAIIAHELARRPTGRRVDEDEAYEAHALLAEALRALEPLSQVESPQLQLTLAQQTYAQARVWLLALRSKLYADGQSLPDEPDEAQGDADGLSEIGPVDLTRPRCMMRVVAPRLPSYPRMSQVAAVTLFFRTDADGEIVAHQVAARAGAPEFAEAIERVIGTWRMERRDESAPNCRMEASVLQTVSFRLRR